MIEIDAIQSNHMPLLSTNTAMIRNHHHQVPSSEKCDTSPSSSLNTTAMDLLKTNYLNQMKQHEQKKSSDLNPSQQRQNDVYNNNVIYANQGDQNVRLVCRAYDGE